MRLFVLTVCVALALPAMADEEIGVGLPAPSFSLRAINSDVAGVGWLALDNYAGEEPEDEGSKLVLLSFFASWCGPCKQEMPFLVQMDRMYREQGLRVIGVCIDTEEPGISTAKKMLVDAKVGYPVVSDRFNFLARRYLGESAPLPSVFLIRRDGAIARIERGYSKDVGGLLLASIQQELGLKVSPAAAKEEPKIAAGEAPKDAAEEAEPAQSGSTKGRAGAKKTGKAAAAASSHKP